jgi:hypothetical protein
VRPYLDTIYRVAARVSAGHRSTDPFSPHVSHFVHDSTVSNNQTNGTRSPSPRGNRSGDESVAQQRRSMPSLLHSLKQTPLPARHPLPVHALTSHKPHISMQLSMFAHDPPVRSPRSKTAIIVQIPTNNTLSTTQTAESSAQHSKSWYDVD